MDLFIAKPKPRLKKMPVPSKTVGDSSLVNNRGCTPDILYIFFQALDVSVASDDDGGFDVSDLMNAVPPIADADEDFDDI